MVKVGVEVVVGTTVVAEEGDDPAEIVVGLKVQQVRHRIRFSSVGGEVFCHGSRGGLLSEVFFRCLQLQRLLPHRGLLLLAQNISNNKQSGPLLQPYFLSLGLLRQQSNNMLFLTLDLLPISPIRGLLLNILITQISPLLSLRRLAS